ncbi:hypothetical protein B0I31_108144 [Saccharothrix carnea]|uniref:Uncharacterized protein n=1 Tax=Saccharothrix carnea TaxID=1280637 RepID=A0A2P8I5F2_SACCR|nr:hypothetical protein B0I31_108144 [Saccharothrix carnea]
MESVRVTTRRRRDRTTAERREADADNVIEKRFNAVEKIRRRALSNRESNASAANTEKFFGVTM